MKLPWWSGVWLRNRFHSTITISALSLLWFAPYISFDIFCCFAHGLMAVTMCGDSFSQALPFSLCAWDSDWVCLLYSSCVTINWLAVWLPTMLLFTFTSLFPLPVTWRKRNNANNKHTKLIDLLNNIFYFIDWFSSYYALFVVFAFLSLSFSFLRPFQFAYSLWPCVRLGCCRHRYCCCVVYFFWKFWNACLRSLCVQKDDNKQRGRENRQTKNEKSLSGIGHFW